MGYFASSLLSPPGWRNLHIHDFSTPKSSRKTPSGELSATIGEPFATTGALLQPLHGLLCSSARWKPPSDFGYSSPSSSILLPQPSPAHPLARLAARPLLPHAPRPARPAPPAPPRNPAARSPGRGGGRRINRIEHRSRCNRYTAGILK